MQNIFKKIFSQNKVFLSRSLALMLVLVMPLSLFACGKTEPIELLNQEIIMTIEGNDVAYDLYKYFFLNIKNQMNETTPGIWDDKANFDKNFSELKEAVLSSLKGVFSVVSLGKEYEVTFDSEIVKANTQTLYDDVVASYDSKSAFEKDMQNNFMNEKVLKYLLAIDEIETEVYNSMLLLGEINDQDETVMEAINSDYFIRVLQIFIGNDKDDSKDANKELAESIYTKLQAGEDFDKLIGMYSEDYTMTTDGYYYAKREMLQELEAVAFDLAINEVSPVVETSLGFHIMKRLEKDLTYIADNFLTLKRQYLASQFYEKVDTRTENLKFEYKDIYSNININTFN